MGNKIKVTQIRSVIGCSVVQKRTLMGLGVGKIGKSKELQDTESIKGMLRKVRHLVTVANV